MRAWNQGQYDNWATIKGPMATMSYMTREDIPYHYALADAFTVGDAYHCSIMGPTNPNRMLPVDGLHRQPELPGLPAAPTASAPGR